MTISFYYTVPSSDVGYLKDSLDIMYVPYWIEQSSEKWKLNEGEVAFVFPEVHTRVYHYICELFHGYGLHYPE
ncbi:hypothetical protein EDM52_14680 [Brevibacillus invocatus]|uniref:Uncharacterized protein n=1 Tax=Brevibacillus invocatus TaxID=173959 RepID=A0A3M8C9D9_9BACL|nr:hypothetical protein [Brevibacillus invocatus]RNB71997.1 hypothetical protein EDM52_14680 [Brevibacillus invocatus]